MRGCYLLHFEPRFRHAGHYLGYADDIERRVKEHQTGKSGARLPTAAVQAGCALILVRTWPDADRTVERKLKGTKGKGRTGSLARICPTCKQAKVNAKNERVPENSAV